MYVENCTVRVFVQTGLRLTLILLVLVARAMCVCSCVSSTVGGTKYWGSDPQSQGRGGIQTRRLGR